jgi:hypothetical protein
MTSGGWPWFTPLEVPLNQHASGHVAHSSQARARRPRGKAIGDQGRGRPHEQESRARQLSRAFRSRSITEQLGRLATQRSIGGAAIPRSGGKPAQPIAISPPQTLLPFGRPLNLRTQGPGRADRSAPVRTVRRASRYFEPVLVDRRWFRICAGKHARDGRADRRCPSREVTRCAGQPFSPILCSQGMPPRGSRRSRRRRVLR